MTKAHIYSPTRTAMQSGQARTNKWLLVFTPEAPLFVDPLMGWSGMTDTTQEVHLHFDSEEAAVDYAKRNNLAYELAEPKKRIVKPKSYATNFAFNRVIP